MTQPSLIFLCSAFCELLKKEKIENYNHGRLSPHDIGMLCKVFLFSVFACHIQKKLAYFAKHNTKPTKPQKLTWSLAVRGPVGFVYVLYLLH
jgi:hypothetical protein